MVDENGPFADVDTFAEALVVLHALNGDGGMDAVGECLAMGAKDFDRGFLSRVARDLRNVGLDEIAAIVTVAAKTAPRGPPTFKEKIAARLRAKRRRDRAEAKAARKASFGR